MKFPLWATILTLLGVTVLCGLGYWQLQRLAWKEGLISQIDAEYVDEHPPALKRAELAEDFQFRRRVVTGTYDYSKEIKVGPRSYESQSGYYIITPLQIEDGSYILVNRGWAPQAWPAGTEQNAGKISVSGLLRKPADRNDFTPDNRPAKNEWFFIDPVAIKDAKNLSSLSAYVLYQDARQGPQNGEYPHPVDSRPALRNDHLQYAIFWFTMAGILLVIYALRFLKKAR